VRNWLEKRLAERLLDTYLEWRMACRAVNEAYCSWVSATGGRARAEFVRYRAALDKEEFAADAYADVVHRAGRVVQNDPGLRFQAWRYPWP